MTPEVAAQRSKRLLAFYPREWRVRYGDELVALATDQAGQDIVQWRFTANIVTSGLAARWRLAGLSTCPPENPQGVRAALSTASGSLAVVAVLAIAMWSQLAIGWRWTSPRSSVTATGMGLMSVAVLVMVAAGVAALLATVAAVLPRFRRLWRTLSGPTLVTLTSVVVLISGAGHFRSWWPGTGGRRWSEAHLIPAGVASFSWASTMSVSTYWAHPTALERFPLSEVGWMAVSPLALVLVISGGRRMLRAAEVGRFAMSCLVGLTTLSLAAGAIFVLGACVWIYAGVRGPQGLYHAGLLDELSMMLMLLASAVALKALSQVWRGRRSLLHG